MPVPTQTVLFLMCAGNELFYAMLYLAHFTSGPFYLFSALCVLCAPVAIVKTGISLVQLYAACQNVVAIDNEDRRQIREKST